MRHCLVCQTVMVWGLYFFFLLGITTTISYQLKLQAKFFFFTKNLLFHTRLCHWSLVIGSSFCFAICDLTLPHNTIFFSCENISFYPKSHPYFAYIASIILQQQQKRLFFRISTFITIVCMLRTEISEPV